MNQGTPEWLAMRAGHCTASRFKDVLAKGKGITRRNYLTQIVTERLTGLPCESYRNAAMEWGIQQEPMARLSYEASRGVLVVETDFVTQDGIAWVGCSPDGLIGEDGGVEIKCPQQSAVHVETLTSKMPTEHRAQIQGALWITGRKWWDFISYDPRMPENLQLYVERIERDEDYIKTLADEVAAFLSEVESIETQLRERAA